MFGLIFMWKTSAARSCNFHADETQCRNFKFRYICYTNYSIVSVCTRFGVHDTGYSLSPPLFSHSSKHSCLAKARARWNESERKPLVSLRLSDAVSLRRTQSVPSRSPFGQKEARNEHSELGSLFTIRVTRRSRPVSTYGDNTVYVFYYQKTFKLYAFR